MFGTTSCITLPQHTVTAERHVQLFANLVMTWLFNSKHVAAVPLPNDDLPGTVWHQLCVTLPK